MTGATILLAGEPGAGKTTAMRRLIMLLSERRAGRPWKCGLARGTWFEHHAALVLGVYDGGKFDGTDRLPMNLMGDDAWKQWLVERWRHVTVLAEGDRTTNATMLTWAQQRGDVHAVVLATQEHVAAQRRRERGTEQNDAWVRGRQTKVARWAQQAKAERMGQDEFVAVAWSLLREKALSSRRR